MPTSARLRSTLATLALAGAPACFSDAGGTGSTTQATGDETTSGSAEGGTTTGGCAPGMLGCPCYPNGTCNGDAACTMGVCVPPGCEPGMVDCTCVDSECLGDLVCDTGVCHEPSATSSATSADDTTTGSPGGCENRSFDPDDGETDLDCGGPCPPCTMGQACVTATDCVEPLPCVDGLCCEHDCTEPCYTCGMGGLCVAIPEGQDLDEECPGDDACNGTGACGCNDGQQGGEETDRDCGGPVCPPCTDGGACLVAADCTSQLCPATDLFCCNDPCEGTCQACAESKTGVPNGVCSPVTNNTDPDDDCTGAAVCVSGLCQ